MIRGLFLSVLATVAFSVLPVHAASKTLWSYSGNSGPQHWSMLDPAYVVCGSGKNQSPINLTRIVESDLPPIAFHYQPGGTEILNNGHTIQINFEPGSSITLGGQSFELKQLHFHVPSENTIEGNAYAMEGHLVHADKNGNLAVIAVMYSIADKSAELAKAWNHMPLKAGQTKALPDAMDASAMLPGKPGHYRFNGSLTTPPCTEGVRWLVMKYDQTASAAQIEKFTKALHGANNRPLQPVNARIILK